jgi:hypothetical protein
MPADLLPALPVEALDVLVPNALPIGRGREIGRSIRHRMVQSEHHLSALHNSRPVDGPIHGRRPKLSPRSAMQALAASHRPLTRSISFNCTATSRNNQAYQAHLSGGYRICIRQTSFGSPIARVGSVRSFVEDELAELEQAGRRRPLAPGRRAPPEDKGQKTAGA